MTASVNKSSGATSYATPGDVNELVRLRHLMFRDMAASGVAARPDVADDSSWYSAAELAFHDQMAAGRLAAVVVRMPDSTSLAGCAVAQVIERLPGPGFPTGVSGSLSSVYVEPEQRGRGLGRALTVAALGWLESAGAEVIDLHATFASERLYRSLGFDTAASIALRRVTGVG